MKPQANFRGLVVAVTIGVVGFGGFAYQDAHDDLGVPTANAGDPVVFVENFYRAVLSGDASMCAQFTPAGEADFVADMAPAGSCAEAVSVLGNAVGPDGVEEYTATHTYLLGSRTASAATVHADFGGTADLMALELVDGQWRVGPTTKATPSGLPADGQDPTTTAPDHDHP